MDLGYEKEYHKLELEHWWFQARRHAILTILAKLPKESRILEIGCSGGALLLNLKKHGFNNTEGIDISSGAIETAKSRGLTNVRLGSGESTGARDASIDILIAADVLEHIQDEAGALEEWRRVLKPQGLLILFVPAFKSLWSEHDVQNQHLRRYMKSDIIRLLDERGFKVESGSYWNFFLFFPTWIYRTWAHFLPKGGRSSSQLFRSPHFINSLLAYLLKIENVMLLKLGLRFPVGVSVFLLARKN